MKRPIFKKWLKRACFLFLFLALCIGIFHRPICFKLLRLFVDYEARKQSLAVDYEVGGTIFSTLEITNFWIRPIRNEVIQRVDIESLLLRYSLLDFLRGGVPALLKEFDLRNAHVEIRSSEEVKEQEKEGSLPMIFPDILNIENLNLLVHCNDGDFAIEEMFLKLDATRKGILRINILSIPGIRSWEGISATTRYKERNLIIENLVLDSKLMLPILQLDLSRLGQQEIFMAAEAKFHDASIACSARLSSLNKDRNIRGKVSATDLSFGDIDDYFSLSSTLRGKLKSFLAEFDGHLKEVSSWTGNAKFQCMELVMDGRPVADTAEGVLTVENQQALLKLHANTSQNLVEAEGHIGLAEPFAYKGNLHLQMKDLSPLQSITASQNGMPEFSGALEVFWQGAGSMRPLCHSGDFTVDLQGARLGMMKEVTTHLNVSYGRDFISAPDFYFSADKVGNAIFSLLWKDNQLQINHFALSRQKVKMMEGELSIPLHLSEYQKLDRLIPNDASLRISVVTNNLHVENLWASFSTEKPPIEGAVNLNLDAQGTLENLSAKLNLHVGGLRVPTMENLKAANFRLNGELKDDILMFDGILRQNLIQPVRLSGKLPFDVVSLRQGKGISDDIPVDAQITMANTSLDFLPSLILAIRQSPGNMSIDARVKGSIMQPRLSGNVLFDLRALRFTDISLPPIDNFQMKLHLSGDQVSIDRCFGKIAGGSINATGKITFQRWDEPMLDLRVQSRDALVLQDDSISSRISSDLTINGKATAASVSGRIFVTRSYFFKNIDILPIGLPGRPAPQPPPANATIGFRNTPFRDWKFDVAIKTLDPFLITGNLARGEILADLQLKGTGSSPWVDGTVRVERLVASLPFSRLRVDSGLLHFTQAHPFIPEINLRATSFIRDYEVSVFLSGPITDPQALFTSNPPLPETDIVSLLATGMTARELTGNPEMLAGQAALLAFQKLYRRIFPEKQSRLDKKTLLNRVQFDIGMIDPKTGKQSVRLGIPLADQLVLSGGLDVGGNFRGQLKYFIRFR